MKLANHDQHHNFRKIHARFTIYNAGSEQALVCFKVRDPCIEQYFLRMDFSHFLPNGLVFVLGTYSHFVHNRVRNILIEFKSIEIYD